MFAEYDKQSENHVNGIKEDLVEGEKVNDEMVIEEGQVDPESPLTEPSIKKKKNKKKRKKQLKTALA